MTQAANLPLVINGWTVFAHPLFLDQLEATMEQVEALRLKAPAGFRQKNASKRLAAISRLAFEVIPQDPERTEYRQGKTLGEDHKHCSIGCSFAITQQAKSSFTPG
jgi:toxin YhaV